jgi:hypothetical protein
MVNAKVIAAFVVVGLALLGIVIVVMIRPREAAADTPGQRLLAHSRDRNDYRMLVGVPAANPTAWAEVSRVSESSVTLRDSRAVKLSEVTAYLVAYPSGTLVDRRGPDALPMPAWASGLKAAEVTEQDELTPADLKEGQSLVRIAFGRSTAKPDSRDHYSTTLTNVSDRRVRVLKFAGYSRSGSAFVLNTVSGRFFTAADFKEWYGQAADWIAPGQAVTDPNNYGSPPVLWAYYCEAEGGRSFLTGGVIE